MAGCQYRQTSINADKFTDNSDEYWLLQQSLLSCCSTSVNLLKFWTRMTLRSWGALAIFLSSSISTPLPIPSATILVWVLFFSLLASVYNIGQ